MTYRGWMTLRAVAGAAAMLVGVSGCTAAQETGARRAPVEAHSESSPRAETSPRPRPRQPLVLVTNITAPTVRMNLRTARAVLGGTNRNWRVVAAPDLPVERVRRVSSARAAVKVVERDLTAMAVVPASAVGPTVRAVVVAGVDPIREPRRYRLKVSGPVPPSRPTTLGVVGDLMLARGVLDAGHALAPLTPTLRAFDLTVGNLESTVSDDGIPQQGDDSFAAPPTVIGVLERAGFDAVSLANNHTGDFQDAALLQTVRRLRESRIKPFGAGRDLAAAGRPVILKAGDTSFGFMGFNSIGETPRATRNRPGALSVRMPPRTGPLNMTDLRHVLRLVERLAERVDAVVVLPHWGTQYTHFPEPVQRVVARRLVAAGADLVVGGHPHWVQGLDRVRRAVVAHSLGNFVFDMDFMTQTQQGVMLKATFWGPALKAVELLPYRMDAEFAPRSAGAREGKAILSDVWRTSTGPFRSR